MQSSLRKAVCASAVCALAMLAATSPAQDKPATAPAASQPVLTQAVEQKSNAFVFEKTKHDYGTITEGEIVEVKFPFKNTTDRTINIKAINTSCGCTSANDNPRVIAPGQASEIKVSFNSTGKPGKGQKTISVVTDETEAGGLYTLTIGGEVTQTLFSSEPVINLGELSAGEQAEHTFKIISLTDPPAKVEKLSIGDERIKMEIGGQEPYTHKDGRNGFATPIKLTIPSDYPPSSQLRTTLTVMTSDTKRGALYLAVNGSVVGNFVLSPQRVLLGRLAPGEQKETRLTLRSKADEPFEVSLATKSTASNFTVTEVPAEGKGLRQWSISFKAPDQAGNFNETIDLVAKSASREEKISVPLSAYVRAASPGTAMGTTANIVAEKQPTAKKKIAPASMTLESVTVKKSEKAAAPAAPANPQPDRKSVV